MDVFKTPGVYIREVSKLPPSVAQVETAIPAFIGYTATAVKNQETRFKRATVIESMAEFESIFGGAAPARYVTCLDAEDRVDKVVSTQPYLLHESLRLYFDNGGGKCYIIAVAAFRADGQVGLDDLKAGLAELEKHDEPTIIVAPDATLLATPGLYDFQQQALRQCALLGDRVVLCDTYSSNEKAAGQTFADRVQDFRDKVGINDLKYGAAYGPYLRSSLPKKVAFRDIALRRSAAPPAAPETGPLISLRSVGAPDRALTQLIFDLENARDAVDRARGVATAVGPGILSDTNTTLEGEFKSLFDAIAAVSAPGTGTTELTAAFAFVLRFFGAIKDEVKDKLPTSVAAAPVTATAAESNALKLRGDIVGLAKTSGLVDAFSKLAAHSIAYGVAGAAAGGAPPPPGSVGSADLMKGPALDKALDVLGVAADAYVALEDSGTTTVYEGGDVPARNAEARRALGAFVPILSKFYSTLLEAAAAYEGIFDSSLEAAMGIYKQIKAQIAASSSLVPPSGAIAGVYARVDAQRGVWKSPANVSLSSVAEPVLLVTAAQQEGLNVDAVSGKSINVIRTFTGKGVLVWGARTLAGNDNEWRYVSVRRFFNMVEESCKKATEPFVFEPNDANTWIRVQGMLENFLTLQWRAGALQGAKPEDAFYVSVGLGKTMTSLDVLEGRMIVELGMAVVRPAEFIILRFSHLLAKN